jgi:hypothetical protein
VPVVNRAIWKFNLPISDTSIAVMPEHALPLSVAEQDGALYLWAEVNTDAPFSPREFKVRGTGHPLHGNEGKYIGTVVMKNGLVWHVYDEGIKARER